MFAIFHLTLPRGASYVHTALTVLCLFAAIPGALCSAEKATRTYVLPADNAEKSLKIFSEQSGRGLVVDTDMVKDIRTKAVRGELTAREALDQMLAGTGLIAAQDEASGAFTVRRQNPGSSSQRAAQEMPGARPSDKKKVTSFQNPTEQ